jgi:hypothetical protein
VGRFYLSGLVGDFRPRPYTVLKGTDLQEEDDKQPGSSILTRLQHDKRAIGTLYGVVIALIILASFWLGTGRRYLNLDNPRHDIINLQAKEVDYHMLYPSIESKRTFAETFDWWHEAWRADEWVGAYWRPLSMQAWWIEARLFGIDRSHSWMRVSLTLAALFDVLLFFLFWKMTKRRLLALVGLALFALPSWIVTVSPLSSQPRIWNADLLFCQGWKDQPDLFANCLTVGALLLAIDRRYTWALLCAALAPCFKESGLLTFPLVLGVVIYQGDLKTMPKWVYGGVVTVFAFYMYGRWSSGPMVFRFHTHGGDAGAWARYSNAILPLAWLSLASIGHAIAATGVLALLVRGPKRTYIWMASIIGLLASSVGVTALQTRGPLDVALAQFILGAGSALLFLLWLLVALIVWQRREFLSPALFFAACAFFVAVPFAMVTGALEHVLTLARAFQAGYGACVLLAVCAFAYSLFARVRIKRTLSREEVQGVLAEN